MPTSRTRSGSRWARLLPLAALAVAVPAAAQTPPDTAALRRDVRARLEDARALALGVASSDARERLLGAVLAAQLEAAELDGAAATARAIGHDGGGAFTRVVCALVGAGRLDDAERIARLIPATEERDWALARLALQRAAPQGPHDTVATIRDAVRLARTLASPLPRTDALVRLAERQLRARDTADARAAVDAALDAARGIVDADRRAQRLALLAGLLAGTGRVDEGLRLARGLRAPDDRMEGVLAVATAAGARHPDVRAAVVALARDSARYTDPRARAYYLGRVAAGFTAHGDSLTARRLGQQRFELAIPPSLADSAEALAQERDVDGATRLVERIADPDRLGLRARTYRRLASAIGFADPQQAPQRMLRLARQAALRGAAPALRDDLLAGIARDQLWLADNEGALETLHDVRDPEVVIGAAYQLAMSTFNRADYAEQRRIARALPQAEARDAIMAQTIARHLEGDVRRRALDLAVERARADSIATPRHRATARAAVADALGSRGDAAGARTLWRELLAGAADLPPLVPRAVERLVSLGDTAAVAAWVAARPAPDARARATLAHAQALQRVLDRASRRVTLLRHGPDDCRESF